MTASHKPVVVLLVDNKTRDLAVSSLIAHHLARLGVEPQLQTLEAYRAALAAFKPAMVVINHLTASHLVRWSHRLKELGVLVAVLPNEGIIYDADDLRFAAGRYHNKANIDHFFTWNEAHRDALREAGFDDSTQIHVVGVPRFDFYFQPWSRLFSAETAARPRPQVLCCTNFVFAKFLDLPRIEGEKFLQVFRRQQKYQEQDPWELVEINHRCRRRSLEFFEKLLAANQFELLLRPHPHEDAGFYRAWAERLPAGLRSRLRIDSASNITKLILECDVEVSCETCTTALESWIAGKPTVELVFERHPAYFHPDVGALNTLCGEPEQLVKMVEGVLREPQSAVVQAARREHLRKWCNALSGQSAETIARIIHRAVTATRPPFGRLTANDYRRGLMLRAFNAIGWPCNYDPLLFLKRRLLPGDYAIKQHVHDKAIRQKDVARARAAIEFCLRKTA
jgi:surface carbohydrate biosynthesis protein